jgi:hypothetical protein
MTNDINNPPTMRPTITEGATANASRDNRKAIPVTCALHQGPRGFANLVIERKPNGDIILDPHVTGACVIILDETAATAIFDVLGKWLGRTRL